MFQTPIASRQAVYVSLIVFFASSVASRAADVLQNVPSEALGFVVVRNLEASDAKVQQFLRATQSDFPGPLAFLKAATGVSGGLDPHGDVLVAILPGATAHGAELQFAVWLPVSDYDRFVTALGGAPGQKIAGVTVAEEDVLVARHGRWALVMDPDQRDRMQRMLAGSPTSPAAATEWNAWIDEHDVAAVVMPRGVRTILSWAALTNPGQQRPPAQEPDDDLFGLGQTDNAQTAAPTKPSDVAVMIRASVQKWATAAPRLMHVLLRGKLVGAALRLDESGELHASLRFLPSDDRVWSRANDETPLPPALYQGGNFVLHGAGELPPPLTAIVAGAYARFLIDDLQNEERMAFRRETVIQIVRAVETASAAAQSVLLLTQPGDKQEGIYTNDYLVVRATSAVAFAEQANEVMRLWNTMNRDAQAETRLIFDVEEVKFGDRTATQYSLDVAAADGAAELPEIRQAMEQFFGPGGKLRLWVAAVDDHNVLLATATSEQVAAAIKMLDRKQPVDWSRSEVAGTNRSLPDDAAWRLFFSPHRYNAWYRRQMQAITGPVVGGPLVHGFSPSPPIGFAGGIRNGELWIDAVLPPETSRAIVTYLKE